MWCLFIYLSANYKKDLSKVALAIVEQPRICLATFSMLMFPLHTYVNAAAEL